MEDFEKMFKTQEDIKSDIIKSFSIDLANEINKLVEKYGKDELIKMMSDIE